MEVEKLNEHVVYILIGDENWPTEHAKELLNRAGVEYRFAYAGSTNSPLPQLVSGLCAFVGLEQIARAASRANAHLQDA